MVGWTRLANQQANLFYTEVDLDNIDAAAMKYTFLLKHILPAMASVS